MHGSVRAYAESKKELSFHGEDIKLTVEYFAVDFALILCNKHLHHPHLM